MRKVTVIVTLFALLMLAVVPGMAQEEPGTIAEIVVAAASAETPEFATLLAAVSAADPAVLEALSNPDAELTVFAPTDAAFAALAEALGEEAFAGVLADQAALTGILTYHVVPAVATSADVVAALEMGAGRVTYPTVNGQYIDITVDEDGVIYVDDATLVLEMVDIQASNGVIHVIDAVILPETRTIAEIVVEAAGMGEVMEEGMAEATEDAMMMEDAAPEFTALLAAVSAADPAVLEALSNPDAQLTVFAPTDAAFAALGEDTLTAVLADQPTLTNILLYHVVDGRVYSNDIAGMAEAAAGEALEVPTLLGAPLTVLADVEGITVNESNVIVANIDAANGVIHVIDAVLLPPSGE